MRVLRRLHLIKKPLLFPRFSFLKPPAFRFFHRMRPIVLRKSDRSNDAGGNRGGSGLAYSPAGAVRPSFLIC